jgi:serine/threonine protein kinase
MSPKPCYCINPACQQPDHPENNNSNTPYCLSCGSQLLLKGQFRVSRLLSDDSGFGNIYEVFQGFSAKILKVLKPEWNSEPKAIELFKQEYAVLKELSQQGVRGIPQGESYFEYPTQPGLKLYCLVMEKVEGIDLIQWLKNNGKLNQSQALKWLREILLILDKIHQKNYFHRDIKPPNIMMRNNGELVLIDFGTAREKTQTYYQKLQGRKVTGITSAGYTPIEQQNGEAVAQSDFFALGRTFVHLFTGKHPCDMYDPMRDVLSWRGHTENIHPLLLDLIDKLMARLATDRPKNTQEILQRLDRLEQNLKQPQNPVVRTPSPARPQPQPQNPVVRTPSPARPKPQSQNHWIRNSLITVGSITLLGLGIVSLRPSGIDITKLTPIEPTNAQNISLAQTLSRYFPFFLWESVYSVAFSPDGQVLASGSDDGTIKLWEVKTGRVINSLRGHSNLVSEVAFSPDGKVLASGSYDSTIKLWEVKTGRVINSLRGHSNHVISVAFSPDGKVLASGSYDNTIKLWSVATGREINSLRGHSDPVHSVAFSPDGKVLASGSYDSTIKLWEVATGRVINSLSDQSYSLAFSPDGKVLASGSNDTIKLWEVATGRVINSLSGHSDLVISVAFSPDGKVLASGSNDSTIKLWEVATGRVINSLSGHSASVASVAFSPDGKVLASGSHDKTIKLWRVGN